MLHIINGLAVLLKDLSAPLAFVQEAREEWHRLFTWDRFKLLICLTVLDGSDFNMNHSGQVVTFSYFLLRLPTLCLWWQFSEEKSMNFGLSESKSGPSFVVLFTAVIFWFACRWPSKQTFVYTNRVANTIWGCLMDYWREEEAVCVSITVFLS